MTIRFICGCGKHLRARDEMARMRVVCPGCGTFVGVPALTPTMAGGAGPMTPQERIRHARGNAQPHEAVAPPETFRQEEPTSSKPAGRRVRLHTGKGPRQPSTRHLERHWYEVLVYPLRAWRLCLALAMVLTLLSVGLLVWLPTRINSAESANSLETATMYLTAVLLALLIVGLPCSFLDRVLTSAASGEVDYIVWSGNAFTTFLLAAGRWLACFLAGPAIFAGVGGLYWVRCGETSWVDVSILGEIGVVAVAYFILTLMAVADREQWIDLNPLAVADLAHRLGWRALAVVAAAVGLLALGLLLIAGVTEVHRGTLQGWLMLTGGWFGGVFAATFFARLFGVWCHRTRTN